MINLATCDYMSFYMGTWTETENKFESGIMSLPFIGQDMVNSYFLHQVDLHALRQHPQKSFFDLTDCVGADCALAGAVRYPCWSWPMAATQDIQGWVMS